MFLSYSFFRLKDFVTRRSTVVSKVNPMTCHGFYQTLVEVQKKKKYNLTVFLRKDKSLNYLFSIASRCLVRFCIVQKFFKPHNSRTYSILLIYKGNFQVVKLVFVALTKLLRIYNFSNYEKCKILTIFGSLILIF